MDILRSRRQYYIIFCLTKTDTTEENKENIISVQQRLAQLLAKYRLDLDDGLQVFRTARNDRRIPRASPSTR